MKKGYLGSCIPFAILLFHLSVAGQQAYVEENPQLAYWKLGKGATTVIVLHGGPCVEHTYLRPEFDQLKKVATVIYYDQRGCGKSALDTSYLWQDHVADLKRVIHTQTNGKRVFLAGSSWGSALALLYTYHYPQDIKGLILSGLFPWEGMGIDDEKYDLYQKRKIRGIRRPRIREFTLKENRLVESTTEKGIVLETLIPIERTCTWHTGIMSRQPRVSLATAPIFDSLQKIKTPALLFNGTAPCHYLEAVDQYKELLPNSSIVHIKGACHDPWLSNPELFFDRSCKFVRRHKRKRRLTMSRVRD